MCAHLHEAKELTITQLANWFLAHPDDDIDSPTAVVDAGHRSFHHTCVVLKSQLNSADLNQYLYYLRHAKGQINRPPGP